MEKLRYRLTSPALMWTIVIVGIIILWLTVPEGRLFDWGAWGIVALVLGIANLIYVTRAVVRVHRKAPESVQNIDQLVTEGAYAVVRHPAYVSDVILVWCVFVAFPTYKMLAVAIWLSLVVLSWAGLEERMLEEKFLEDYREYKKRVPMFIPNWRKRRNP